MNMIRLFNKQIKAHPITILFFIIGYFISMLTISVGISNKVNINDMIIEANNGIYKNSLDIQFNFVKDIKYDDVLRNFKDISKGSKIVIDSLSSVIGESEVKLVGEFFMSDGTYNVYPLIKGRLYTAKEIENKDKVVVVGKELQSYITTKNNISYINIGGCDYKVIGIVGHTQKPSLWDNEILMPATSVPESSKTSFLMMHSGSAMLISKDNMEGTDCKSIINNFKKIDSESNVNAARKKESNNTILDSLIDDNSLFSFAGIIFAFSIINIINISSFWINERRNEIGIKKAFGIKNFQIIMMLFMEFMSITLITAVITLGFQFLLSIFVKKLYGYYIVLSLENFLLAIGVSILSALITVIIPSIEVLKINPVEALKS